MILLNVTPDEALEIQDEERNCQRGNCAFDEPRWLKFMQERFAIPPGQYELRVRWNAPYIPSPGIPRIEDTTSREVLT